MSPYSDAFRVYIFLTFVSLFLSHRYHYLQFKLFSTVNELRELLFYCTMFKAIFLKGVKGVAIFCIIFLLWQQYTRNTLELHVYDFAVIE